MNKSHLRIREISDGIEVRLHVVPRARRDEIAGTHDDALKIKITAPPVDDAANRAIVRFLAELLRISCSRIQIAAGERSKDKLVRIQGISPAEFLARIP